MASPSQQPLAASLPSELLARIFTMAEPAVNNPHWETPKRPDTVLTFEERLRAECEC